jgi:hypothetical protein
VSTGQRVGGGRLRVDAARAVDKLRDYQLADPALWVLEVIRAAVLAGAERIDVHGDTDDVSVGWEGRSIDPDDLTRLFDELVDPAPRADRRHLRLLATGVNTALGTEPRWVDVIACEGDEVRAVRYTPGVLERTGDAAEGLRNLTVETRARPARAPARGALVHLRRFPMLSAMPILVGIGEPRELTVVRRACDDLGVPLTIQGRAQIGRERSHEDLLRLQLDEGLDGFLALLDPSFAQDEGRLEVAELGVHLARYTLPLPGLEERRGKVPVRLFVNAPRMPTNASRSAVRLEDPPVRDALVRAHALLPRLVETLVKELGEAPTHAWSPTQRERLREAALALLAAAVAGEDWRDRVHALSGAYGEAVAPLAQMPLVRDAMGRPRAPKSFSRRLGSDVVWYGKEPVPSELEPWLGEVAWVPPGDAAARLLGAWEAPSAARLLASARSAKAARERWLEEPVRPASVPVGPGQLLSVPLKAPGRSLRSVIGPALFGLQGVEGEVVIGDPRRSTSATVSLRVGGRELEEVGLGLPIAVSAVADSTALRPAPDYRTVERDDAFDAVMRAVRAGVVVACEALAWELLRAPKQGARATVRGVWEEDSLLRVVRAGLALATELVGADAVRRSSSPLLLSPTVRLLGGGTCTVREVLDEVARGVLAWVPPGTAGALPGRVVVLDEQERATFEALLGPLRLLDGRPALRRPSVDVSAVPIPQSSAAILLEEPHRRVHIAWNDGPCTLELVHRGRLIERRPLVGGRCHVVVEDARLVPDESFTALRDGGNDYPLDAWEHALAHAFVDALDGSPPKALRVDASTPRAASVAWAALLELLGAGDPKAVLGDARVAKLRRAPLVTLLGTDEPTSLDALAKRFDDEIPFVPVGTRATVDLGDFAAACLSPREAHVYAQLLGRAFVDATEELTARVRAAARTEALEAHRQKPVEPLPAWTAMAVTVSGRGFRPSQVAFAWELGVAPEIQVRVEGRAFLPKVEAPWPVRAVLDFDATAVDDAFLGLTPAAKRKVGYVLARGARELLAELPQQDAPALLAWPPARALLDAWVLQRGVTAADHRLGHALAAVRAFRNIQGEHASVQESCTENGAVRVAVWDEPWLGPKDDRASVYDHGVIALPRDEAEAARLRAVLEALAPAGLRDVTTAIARLQAERRVERGLVQAPRVPEVPDARFRYPLSELLAQVPEVAEVLPLGEAALTRGPLAKLLLFDAGVSHRALELELVPRVVVAAESPLLPRNAPLRPNVQTTLEGALRAVTAQVIRRVVDSTPPEQLPPWVRRELRESCLVGGTETHYAHLATTPMFETTTGGWLTPTALREQHERFGPVWWTRAPIDWAPLEEGRVALRLQPEEARRLGSWVAVMDGTQELELDRRARANRDRPPVVSLEPSEAERREALSVVRLEPEPPDESARGVVILWKPGRGEPGVWLHREMRPLGRVDDPCHWPTLARIDDPALTPNRTWDGVDETIRLATIRQRLREAVASELLRLVPTPNKKLTVVRARSVPRDALGLPPKAVLEGVAWLEREPPGVGRLVLLDDRGERTFEPTREGRPLPIHGTLWLAGASFGVELAPRIAQVFYAQLVQRAAASLRDEPAATSLELVHVLHGIAHRAVDSASLTSVLPCFAPPSCTIASLFERVAKGERVVRVTPDELEAVRAVHPTEALPLFVDDGSPVAVALRDVLGGSVVGFQSALRERVLGEAAEPLPVVVGGAARDGARDVALQAALEERLRDAGVPGVTWVELVRGRKRPAVTVEGYGVQLAAAHPEVRALREAVESGAPSRDARLALFVARVVGALRRSRAVGMETEHAVLRALLERIG